VRWKTLGACVIVSGSTALGCAGAGATLAPTPLLTHQDQDKPPLVVIEREGDAQGGLAWAVSARTGHDALAAVADAVAQQLGDAGFLPRVRVTDDSLLVASELPDAKSARRWFDALHRGVFEARLKPSKRRAELDVCGFAPPEPLGYDAARRALGYANSALSVVGDERVVDAVTAAYGETAAWPEGSAPVDPWPERDRVTSRRSAAGERLSIALRLGDGGSALGAAEAVGGPESTLRLLASAAAPGWQLERVSASLRPSGGCLLADFSTSSALESSHVARAAQALADEMQHAVVSVKPLDPAGAARRAADPVEAALRAAWGALGGRVEPGESQRRHILHSSSSPAKDLAARLAKPAELRIEPTFRTERGQGRSWVLLTSACPTAHEDTASAGHTAALILAAAGFAGSEQSPIRVEPWVSSEGLGLIASGPAGRDGQLEALVEEMGRALLAADSDPSWQSVAREELMSARIPSPGWDFALRLASNGHPSQLVPAGVQGSLGQLTPSAGSRALRGFLGGELRLAVLTPAPQAGVRAAAERLQSLLLPLGTEQRSCATRTEVPNVGGLYLSSEASDDEAILIFPIHPKSVGVARAAADLLNLPGGWLDKAVLNPGLASSAQAMALGSGSGHAALALTVSAEPEVLMDAVAQARGLFQRLSRAQFGRAALASLRALRVGRAAAGNDPRHRLIALVTPPAPPVSEAMLRKFFRQELLEDRLVVVGPQPAGQLPRP